MIKARRKARAGGFARRRARERYWRVLRKRIGVLASFVVLFYVALFAAHAAWPEHVGDVFLGAMLMVPPFGLSVVIASDPKAASWARGADGEEWTSAGLHKALSSEYRVVNDVQFESTNADHVIVGPAGVIVVETKWSSKAWAGDAGYGRIRQAASQSKNAARLVARLLADHEISTTPEPLVVLWGGEIDSWPEETRIRNVNGVTVVAGLGLDTWARRLPSEGHTREDTEAVVTALERLASRRA